MDIQRTHYIYKGTPNKPHTRHSGDFKVLKAIRKMDKDYFTQLQYYKSFLKAFQKRKLYFDDREGHIQWYK